MIDRYQKEPTALMISATTATSRLKLVGFDVQRTSSLAERNLFVGSSLQKEKMSTTQSNVWMYQYYQFEEGKLPVAIERLIQDTLDL